MLSVGGLWVSSDPQAQIVKVRAPMILFMSCLSTRPKIIKAYSVPELLSLLAAQNAVSRRIFEVSQFRLRKSFASLTDGRRHSWSSRFVLSRMDEFIFGWSFWNVALVCNKIELRTDVHVLARLRVTRSRDTS